MIDVIILSAPEDRAEARRLAEAVERAGYGVRWDEAPSAAAAIVIWSEKAVASRQVRAAAEAAYLANKLIQVAIDERMPPLPFRMLHCVALGDWRGEVDHPGWTKVSERLEQLAKKWLPGTDSNHRPTG